MRLGSLLERRTYVASGSSRTAIAAVALFAVTLAWRLLTFTGFTNDHHAHLALAQQMLLGERPVRDFVDPGWPLTYLLSAAAWRIAGDAMWVEWSIVGIALALGTAFTVIAAHRLSGSLTIAVLAAVVQVLVSPRTYSYPKIVTYAAFAAIIVASAAPSRRRLVLLGGIIAIAFLLRHDHGVWIGSGALAYLVLSSQSYGMPLLISRSAVVSGTMALTLLPWVLFVSANGGLISYFETALEFARAEANASALRVLPAFSRSQGILTPPNVDAWVFWLFWSLPFAAAALVFHRWRRGGERWPGELAAVGALVVVAIGVNAGFLRDILRTRFADAIVPMVLLGAWLLSAAWMTPRRGSVTQRLVALAAVVVVVVSVAAIGYATELPDRLDRTNYNAGLSGMYRRAVDVAGSLRLPHRKMPSSRVAATLVPFLEYVDRCTSQSERLIVTGEYPDVVVLAGRRFASDGVVFGAWYSSTRNQHITLQRLLARPALFTILIDEPGFRQRFPAIAGFVDEHYVQFATLETPGVRVPILVHQESPARGTDAETGWPCFR